MGYLPVIFLVWYNTFIIHAKFQDHTCDIKQFQSVSEVSEWTNEILHSQDNDRISFLQGR